MAESDEPGMGERIGEHAQFPNIVDHGRCFGLEKRRDEGGRANRHANARDAVHLDDIFGLVPCTCSISEIELNPGSALMMDLTSAPAPASDLHLM